MLVIMAATYSEMQIGQIQLQVKNLYPSETIYIFFGLLLFLYLCEYVLTKLGRESVQEFGRHTVIMRYKLWHGAPLKETLMAHTLTIILLRVPCFMVDWTRLRPNKLYLSRHAFFLSFFSSFSGFSALNGLCCRQLVY